MTKRVYIYRGLPGSGKTTHIKTQLSDMPIVSADYFFTDVGTGEYRFDPTKLGEAHNTCMRVFLNYVVLGQDVKAVAVDNTNTTVAEIAPYSAVAQAMGYEVEIRRMVCDPEVAFARNIHGVSAEIMVKMAQQFQTLPPWYPQEVLIQTDKKE
jgi:predicted kinase